MPTRIPLAHETYHETPLGRMVHGDSLDVLAAYPGDSADLIMTSPPFGLVRKKDYGNVAADEYVDWFKPFAAAFRHVLKDSGSLVIDIGGAWNKGRPTRSLYHFKLLVMLCEEFGFHLAQDFYWWNPSKLPTPAEWVTVRRIRVKDAVNTVWWLSKTPWPKASNRRVLQPYSPSMRELLVKGYRAKKRPSGHDISTKFNTDSGAAIPPNLIAIPNTESNSFYLRYCEERGLKPHPARYPADLPEYFIRMLTEPGDLVIDPFAGSCVTGEVCERTERRWICIELVRDYCEAALGRFARKPRQGTKPNSDPSSPSNYYRLPRPGILWNGNDHEPLPADGGRSRRRKNHYIPDFILGNFAGDDEALRIMNKKTGRIWAKNPARKSRKNRRRGGYDAFAENSYHPATVEAALGKCESDAAPVIGKIIERARSGEAAELDCEEKERLCTFLLVQILRSPRMKDFALAHNGEFPESKEILWQMQLDLGRGENPAKADHEALANVEHVRQHQDLDGIVLRRMTEMNIDVGIVSARDDASFVIGDEPCLLNGLLAKPGDIATMPLAKDVYVQLSRPEDSTGGLHKVSPEFVRALNAQAYGKAKRFVAGPDGASLESLKATDNRAH